MAVNPYDYVSPFVSKLLTLVCPDIYDATTKDQIRLIMGNLFTNVEPITDLESIFAYEGTGGLTPKFLDLEEATSETGYEIVNINIADNPYISHAEMSTTRIDTIDSATIVPNFKIPMRMYGGDPAMPGGDQFWYTYFMGGEAFGAIYEQKLDSSTIFYDEAMRLPLPYNDLELMAFGADSIYNEKTKEYADTHIPEGAMLDKDPFGFKLDVLHEATSISIKPRMVYYNHWIGKYVPWTQKISTERLIPNQSVYGSLVESRASESWRWYDTSVPGFWFKTAEFYPDRVRPQIGNEMYSYVAQWDLPNTLTNIEEHTKIPLSPIYNQDIVVNPNAGQSALEAKTDIIEKVCGLFGLDRKSYWHKWQEKDRYLANTASCAEYLYYYALNDFSASTLDHVSKRNENIFFTAPHWESTYYSRGPDPDQPVYGLFPYYTKIIFPTHHNESWSAEDPEDWWFGLGKEILEDGTTGAYDIKAKSVETTPWKQQSEFLSEIVAHDFSSKFIEILKDTNDENWSPMQFGTSELIKETLKLDVMGDITTRSRPGKAKTATHQALKLTNNIAQPSYRVFDYMEFVTSIYNNPSEALNTNYMFMGGDIHDGGTKRAEIDSTHENDGMHRYFNSSASIGTITNSANRVLNTYNLMMNRMIETDETMGDGDISDDYYTIKGFLEPNLRHTEVLAYRVEKIGGHTTGDQTNKNVIQNFWSINDPMPLDTSSEFTISGRDALGFCQIFDTQLKYGGDYTYNTYAYVLTIGYRYRYGDFRLTRQLSYDEEEGKYCLEFYDPFTMERASQLFKLGEGLLVTRGVSVLSGLLSFFSQGEAGDAWGNAIFGDVPAGSLSEVMQNLTQFVGTPGVPDGPLGYSAGSSPGGADSTESSRTYWAVGYAEDVPTYTDDQWTVAMSELNRRAGEFLLQNAASLAALPSSTFESTIWKEIGIAGNHTISGQYESIFEQLGKLGGYMRAGARYGALGGEDSGTGSGIPDDDMGYTGAVGTGAYYSEVDPADTTMDFDAMVYREAPAGTVGTIEHSALARLSSLGVSALEVSAHPFMMDYNIYIEPCLKVYEIPMNTRKISMTDNPAAAANAIPFQHIDASKKIGFHCMYESHAGDSLGIPYPPALSSEEAVAKGKYLDSRGIQFFEELPSDSNSKSYQRYLEVFRTDTPPQTYLDFEGKLIQKTDLQIEDSDFSLEDVIFSDKIKENKKYYYLIRFKNDLGVPGWPSPIMEVQLINDGGYNYAVFNEYELNEQEDKNTQLSKGFKKLFQVQPNLSHLTMDTENIDFSRTAGSQLEALDVGVAKDGAIWGKKFKIRLISKKTGKKIDLNIKFNLKEENKFTTGAEAYTALGTTYEP